MLTVLLPGFGYETIDEKIAKLQPWNYLIQIAKNLAKQGHKVAIMPISTQITTSLKGALLSKDISVIPYSKGAIRASDLIITPIAIGFVARIAHLLNSNKKVIGVLTTPLMSLSTLAQNYPRIKLTRTDIALDSIMYENILFRIRAKTVCKLTRKIIVPSEDFEKLLSNILPCDMEVVKLPPQASGLNTQYTNNERNKQELENIQEDEHITITYFGPFTEERGVISLIKAFKHILKTSKNIKLVLLIRGTGSKNVTLLRNLINQVKRNRILLHIGFMGKKDLLRKLYSSDMIILPYRIISSVVPLAFLEALMINKPLVFAVSIPGIKEHIHRYLPKELELAPTYSVATLKRMILKLIEEGKTLKVVLERQKRYVLNLQYTVTTQSIKLLEDNNRET